MSFFYDRSLVVCISNEPVTTARHESEKEMSYVTIFSNVLTKIYTYIYIVY